MINPEYRVNNGQKAKIAILIDQLPGLGDKAERAAYKAQLVREFTYCRETSTSGLYWKEAKDIIAFLEKAVGNATPAPKGVLTPDTTPQKQNKAGDSKRKRIIHFAHQMNWYVGYNVASVDSKGLTWTPPKARVLDMERIDNWCKTYGKYKKVLNDHSPVELSVLITQIEKVYQDYLNAV